MVSGLRPESFTWLAKFVIWATTRQGAVTGETRSRVASSTVFLLLVAASEPARFGEELAGGGGVGVDAGGAAGRANPPGVGGAKDGDAHEVATFRRPRRRVRSNSLSSRSA